MLTFGLACTLAAGDADAVEVSARARALVDAWINDKIARGATNSPPRMFTTSANGYEVDDFSGWELRIAQEADDAGTWVTEVRCVADHTSDAILTIAMRKDADSAQLAPIRYYVEPPSFLRKLGETLTVRVGRSLATGRPQNVGSAETLEGLLDELRSAERTLPLIVVTLPVHGPVPIPDLATKLSSHLFGLANVVELARPETYGFSAAVGKEMSVFDGGLRMYWPGWSPDDALEKHPLFLRRRLEIAAWQDPARPDRLVRSSLVSRLTRAAAGRFAYPAPMLATITASAAKKLKAELAGSTANELVAQVERLTARTEEHRAMEEMAVAENSQLRDEVDRYRSELVAARKELERLRGEIAASKAPGAVPRASPWEIEDPREAIERARTDFAGTLVFPETLTMETSQPGGWWYHALASVHQLCEAERTGKATNKRATLQQLLAQNGLPPKDTYKAGDTGVFVFDPETGAKHECRERVHLTEGKPADTESIYWVSLGDPAAKRRFLIARLGRHA
jgi:hypothetical protein